MQIENQFTVQAPVDELWAFLLDVEMIAPCMPGAELTETVDERTWKGKVNMKLGPVSLSFAGTVEIDERDDSDHRVKLHAKGMEQKGKGAANASVTSWLEPSADGTTVRMVADVQLMGALAQLSRGLLPEVSKQLTAQFAQCLRETILASGWGQAPDTDTTTLATSAQAVSGKAEVSTTASEPPTASATRRAERAPIRGKSIPGIRLALSATWGAIRGLFARLFGRRA